MSTAIPGNLSHNPYDFANPVTELATFAGRGPGLSDIDYYLREARSARPIHLALTGERSAGKTSMLNMVAAKALDLGFLVVRVDLNEGDSEQIEFFARLYDAVLTSVVSAGGFGGRSGTTWTAYRALVDTGTPNSGIPLSFPSHLVAALEGSRRLSIALLSADLDLIQRELDKRVVVILDECDVLSKSRIALQTLRNLFNDLSAFMFVIAGTPNLFTVFDEVFSPIARQFKKLPVAPFAEQSDTQDCIAQPLETMGVDPATLFTSWPREIDEIHRLTGGRPYEIRLLCHTMFKRIQQGAETHMSVNLEALDAVRLDIEQSGVFNVGRSSRKYLELSASKLAAIGVVRAVPDGSASDSFLIQRLQGDKLLDKDTFLGLLAELESAEILRSSEGKFTLVGDQFDEVYLRYLAASRKVYIPAFPLPTSRHLELAIRAAVRPTLGTSLSSISTNASEAEFVDKVTAMLAPQQEGQIPIGRAYEWAALYKAVARLQDASETELVYLSFTLQLEALKAVVYFPGSYAIRDQLESEAAFGAFRARVEGLGGEFRVSTVAFNIADLAPIDQIAPANAEVRELIARTYDDDGYATFAMKKFDASLEAFETAYDLWPSASRATAVAFQGLHIKRWESVIRWTDKTKQFGTGVPGDLQQSLAAYDQALALLMLGRADEAARELDSALLDWNAIEDPKREMHLLRAILASEHSWELVATSRPLGVEVETLREMLRAQPAT